MLSAVHELARTRELFFNLTLRELRTRYKRSALGWAWSMLNPLATTMIYTFVFVALFESAAPVGNPSGLSSYGIFIICAVLPWNYMAIGVGTSMGSITANGGLVKKVAFPREHLVLASVAASLATLFIELAVLAVVLLFFGNVIILQIPGLLLAAALLTLFVAGLSLLLASATVFFRDLNHLWAIVVQLWFFLTPVVYTPELVESKLPQWQFWIYEHLPMSVAVRLFRTMLYDLRYPSIQQFGYLGLWGAATFLLGWRVFRRLSPRFAEEL